MMETPEQSWTVRFEMATCCETTRFEDRGFGSSDDKNSDFRHDKSRPYCRDISMCLSPDERTRFLREISGSVKTVRCEKDLTVGFTWGISYRGLGVGNPDITTTGVAKS
jgi:hypothetical protein